MNLAQQKSVADWEKHILFDGRQQEVLILHQEMEFLPRPNVELVMNT